MRKALIILLAISILFSFTGCNKSDLKDYGEAVEKTDSITSGKTETNIGMDFDFNTEGLTPEETIGFNFLKNIEIKSNMKFDLEEEKYISNNNFSLGGFGFDAKLYMNGQEAYLQMPMADKYIDLSPAENEETEELNNEFITAETQEKIDSKWMNLLQEDNVFSGKDTTMDSPDGDVKVKEYTINIEDDKLKEFMEFLVDVVSEDKKVKERLNNNMNVSNGIENTSNDDMFEMLKEMVKEIAIEDFSYVAYVDIDGYVVNEDTEIDVNFNNNEMINGITLTMESDIWDIDKEQEFNFPKINEDNLLKEEDLNIFDSINPINLDKNE